MYTDDHGYTIHLEGRMLSEGRPEKTSAMQKRDPSAIRKLLESWLGELASDWTYIERYLESQGPTYAASSAYLRYVSTKAVLAAELACDGRVHLLANQYQATGVNFNYQARFDATFDELVELLAKIANALRKRTSELPELMNSKSSDDAKDDTRGNTLKARIRCLQHARHIAMLGREICARPVEKEHKSYNDWLKLSATIERNFQAAIIDHAKEMEALRNARLEAEKKAA